MIQDPVLLGIVYLIAAVLFILGIKQLARVSTARRGNVIAMIGMVIAIVVTALQLQSGWIFVGSAIIAGGVIGILLARFIKMTAMPQLVAIFNGLGGGASALVALVFFFQLGEGIHMEAIAALLGCIIGSITFSGSLIAFGKLQGIVSGKPLLFSGRLVITSILAIALIALSIIGMQAYIWYIVILAILLGILLVLPIGGADMPVVIALLNSYSGIAASMAGFAVGNLLLIISGSLVGASGLILTQIMCKAMNRSLSNVLFGGFGQEATTGDTSEYEGVRSCSAEEAAQLLEGAQRVVIVPGYGMAVAQAQNAVHELEQALVARRCEVQFAIHPVAGRMPGHMNVLLAEADISYDKLLDLDQSNGVFKQTDVVIVLGANDVVNPAAARDAGSPIYGMPILNVHEAKTVIVVKRSLSAGFAGVKNTLFEAENTLMLFDDAKKAMSAIVHELKEL